MVIISIRARALSRIAVKCKAHSGVEIGW